MRGGWDEEYNDCFNKNSALTNCLASTFNWLIFLHFPCPKKHFWMIIKTYIHIQLARLQSCVHDSIFLLRLTTELILHIVSCSMKVQYYVVLRHVTSRQIISSRITSHRITPHRIISYYTMLYNDVSWHRTSSRITGPLWYESTGRRKFL